LTNQATVQFGMSAPKHPIWARVPAMRSSINSLRFEKGESAMTAVMLLSRAAVKIAVAAPMLRPYKMMFPVVRPGKPVLISLSALPPRPRARKCAIKTLKSLHSPAPSVTQSPSESPHPKKSSAQQVTPVANKVGNISMHATRHDEFPCRYTTQGSST
jgi:hypothetical protein